MSHQTKRPFDSVECSTPHDLLIRCSLSNLQFPAIALTWCGLTSHRHRSIEPFFMSLASRDSEFRRWSGRVDRRICQTFAASPAEPGELPLGFSIQFEGIVALDGVSFDMDPGTILGLIGPNGAGKTTLFNCLSRFCSPDSGDIIFQGKSILQRPAHRIRDFESVSCAISRNDSEPTAKRANYVGTCREGGTVPGSCRRLTADDIIVCLP